MKESDTALLRSAEQAYDSDRLQEAIAMFATLCDRGVPEACQFLGLIYRTEEGLLDKQISKHWYEKYFFQLRKRVAGLESEAILRLSEHYQYGDQLPQDNAKARALIIQAAESGLARAQLHLANLYRFGWCAVPVDIDLYGCWLEKAVANCLPEALYQRALDLLGAGSCEAAQPLMEEAAALGCAMAQEHLRTVFLKRDGAPS